MIAERSRGLLYRLRWALACAAVILYLCLIPGGQLPEWDWFALLDLDKLVHAGMFFTLAVFLAQAFHDAGRPVHGLLWAVVLSAAYGVLTEVLQGLEALGRRTDPGDMLANTVGALLMVPYVRWCLRRGRAFVPVRWLR